jgi:hypothetical protein
MAYRPNNPIEKLKTGKRRRPGHPKGKLNSICVDCGKYFHVAPAHRGKIKRCHKCRIGMRGKPRDWRKNHTCPMCEGWKGHKSKICRRCWDEGKRG